jgi:hypothetical protein
VASGTQNIDSTAPKWSTNPDKLSALTARFRNALKKSVEGIIEAGRVLIEAKNELDHGRFTDWVVRELRFGTRKDGSREADLRKAEMLMFLARNEVISNPCHWHAFPPSPRTLWELTQRSSAKAGGHRRADERRTVLQLSVMSGIGG